MSMKTNKSVALLCVYLTISMLGCGNSSDQQSRNMAVKATAHANQINQAMHTHPNVQPNADLISLAGEVEQYAAMAERDGSLVRHEKAIRRNSAQVLKDKNLKVVLLEAAADLRKLAQVPQARHIENPSLRLASYYSGPQFIRFLSPRDCETYEGGFLAIAAIGAVAALGGVDPLGDLLGAIGAVGAAGTYLLCHVW